MEWDVLTKGGINMSYYDRTTWRCPWCNEEWFVIHGEVDNVSEAIREIMKDHWIDHPECNRLPF